MKTREFKTPSGEYVKLVFSSFLKKYWWCFVLPLLATIALMQININFVFVALTLIFIVYPMAMSFVFFTYCIVKEIRWTIMPKTMETTEQGLHLTLENSTHTIKWNELSGYKIKRRFIALEIKPRKFTYLIVPYEAFENKDNLREFAMILRNKITSRQ
ncbi:MAG: YcxB family protein [Muribaculaceae bacterium]